MPLTACSRVPEGIDEWVYKLGNQAQDVWNYYKSGKLSPSDAYSKLEEYESELSGLSNSSSSEMGNLLVWTGVQSLYLYLDYEVTGNKSIVTPSDPDAWSTWLGEVLKGNYDQNMPAD